MNKNQSVSLDDFLAFLPDHSYIFMPTNAFWTAAGVNAALPPVPVIKNGKPVTILKGARKGKPQTVPATTWLDRNRPVHHLTWAPGHPRVLRDHLVIDGGMVECAGVSTFNFYRAPTLKPGDRGKVKPWLDLVRKLYPGEYGERTIDFLAHCVQRPGVKINHGLLMGGEPGIGKDSILAPVLRGVGEQNCREVTPVQLLGRFNGYVKAVILRVGEARDLGEVSRFAFYEHTKPLLANPPSTLRVDEKNTPEHEVLNGVNVIFTTNYLTDGVYLPVNDRRHYVIWTDVTLSAFEEGYWTRFWKWLDAGGDANVVAFLRRRDLSRFDPKAPPPKTAAFHAIVDANTAPEEAELADALDELGNPKAITLDDISSTVMRDSDFYNWLTDRKNRRAIPHRMRKVGYVPARNPHRDDGLWVVNDKRQAVYTKASLPLGEQIAAARELQQARAQAQAQAQAQYQQAKRQNTNANSRVRPKAPRKPDVRQ